MSGRYNIVKEFVVKPVVKKVKSILTGGKQKTYGTGAIKKVSVGKNLTKKRNIQDEHIKSRDKIISGLSKEGKINVKTKNPTHRFKQKIAKILDN
jgi:hypothetical protein